MMNSSMPYSALTRLLTLNNQVHDLQNRLLGTTVPRLQSEALLWPEVDPLSRIAKMQDEIDQGVRASLATCWLGLDEDPE
ncbi:MAG: hypothetical protein QF714_15045 [Dehalococcoidia bacterium]|nr:hypothetical protein [Dehalococcoidia bacterium]MDP6229000.1 hypothetical protein [Dehalococcoidia bacterium]MDP7083587.1 hypothetical protein [Dehalococcoidia bacterium]MDP7199596.1 hypothetical protein [Dehalococcoidia bacterium]MDP7511615.1 hypothetical protein [Dehalococcoidia bacterium]